MQTIKLYDKVVISKAKKGIEVVCSLNHLLSGNVPLGMTILHMKLQSYLKIDIVLITELK